MKKTKLNKLVFSLNGFLFLMGSITLFDEGKFGFGIVQLIAALINISMILNVKNVKVESNLNYAIMAMNVIVCISVGIDNILSGKTYLQYVWFIAAIMSSIALIVHIKKNKAPKKKV